MCDEGPDLNALRTNPLAPKRAIWGLGFAVKRHHSAASETNIWRTSMTLHLKTIAVVSAACLSLSLTISAVEAAQTRGSASWYGAELHGNKTASGERFNQNAYTAAHRSLAFGTRVCVQNRINGRSVTVRINDRGPFTRKRIIDLSRAAANRLGMVSRGTAPVSLRVLNSSSKPGQAC